MLGTVSGAYSVAAQRLSQAPLLSSSLGQSVFDYNYNAAAFADDEGQAMLMVRCQNHGSSAYDTKPSVLALVHAAAPDVTTASVVFSPGSGEDNFGVEDPRVVVAGKNLVMTYTAAQQYSNGSVVARLAAATSPDGCTWTRHGPLFPELAYSKSGAMIVDRRPWAMVFGDSSLVAGLQLAVQRGDNVSQWDIQPDLVLPVRNSSFFDSHLVEAGPPPMRLSDGNYLFVYNSARSGFPSPKPGYSLQYNVGFAILSGTDLSVVQRSEVPLLSPELPWELGTPPALALTPNVVFANGMVAAGPDRFLLFYGGADSVVGTALVTVKF